MARIFCEAECGNAPKKEQLRELNTAFAQNDSAAVLEQLADDVLWQVVGERTIRGIDEVRAAIGEMSAQPVAELHIEHILTHGADGAADGLLTMESGERFAFCDVYRFTSTVKNAKIKVMRSYVIALEDESGAGA